MCILCVEESILAVGVLKVLWSYLANRISWRKDVKLP
jgi:hypothetical protein